MTLIERLALSNGNQAVKDWCNAQIAREQTHIVKNWNKQLEVDCEQLRNNHKASGK